MVVRSSKTLGSWFMVSLQCSLVRSRAHRAAEGGRLRGLDASDRGCGHAGSFGGLMRQIEGVAMRDPQP